MIRKQTAPAKPFTPKTKNSLSTSKPEVVPKEAECACRKRKLSMVDVGIQTEVKQRTVVTRQIKRFREGNTDIEEMTEEKVEF